MTVESKLGWSIAVTIALAGVASGCSEKVTRPVETVGQVHSGLTSTFQVGQLGYIGVDDAYISNHNGGNGITERSETQIFAWNETGADPYEADALIRFNNLTVPAGAHVTSAQLTLTFENWYTGFTLRGYYVKSPWNAAPSAPLGWLNRDTSATWNTPGAKGSGTDVYAGTSFSNSTWVGNGDESKTFALDTSIVQSWVDNPASNQGIILVNNETNDKFLRIYASEDGTIARRPLLSITYDTGTCQTASTGQWTNTAFANQSGTFTTEFDATPNSGSVDAVVGLSNGAQMAYTGLAVALRFFTTGLIDARNGAAYAAVASIPYSAGGTYHFRVVANVGNHTYSAFVRSGSSAEQTVALNYAFRTEQATVTTLNDWSDHAESTGASIQVCGFGITTGGDTQGPSVTMTAPTGGSTVTGTINVSATATDNVGVAGVQFFADNSAIGAEDTVSPYSLTFNAASLSAGSHTFSAHARDAAGNGSDAAAVTVTVSNGDTQAPTVAMTAPTAGSTVVGTIPLSASASDDVGVVGVQFLADGTAVGLEDTSPPYAINFDTTTLSNGPHSLSAHARDAAGHGTNATAVAVTVNNQTGTTGHPRIWLDSSTLSTLRAKAQAGAAAWTSLKNVCNSYLGVGAVVNGPALPPPSNCNLPNICAGYQGEDYVDPAMSLGLCYQIGLGISDLNTSAWGDKGVEILTHMTELSETSGPAPAPNVPTWRFSTDSGYGIRNYGTTMALSYDWLYLKLSSSLKASVYGRLNEWVTWYEGNGFVKNDPHANYFAGYYATKAYAALATEVDNANAGAMWDDFMNRVHGGTSSTSLGTHVGVAAYYTSYLSGGGWTEGWQYGAQSIRNMSLPSLAARTAKNIDLINGATPFQYPLANAQHLIHFTWPSRNYMDDRDTIRKVSTCPGVSQPNAFSYAVVHALLAKLGSNQTLTNQFHKYTKEVRALVPAAKPWTDFLFWDDALPDQDYATLPKSYQAQNNVAMRQDWSTTATWGSFRAMGYVDAADSAEQYPDAGGLAIVRGGTPFLVNPGFMHRCYNETETAGYDDVIHSEIYDSAHLARIFNTFYNGSSGQRYGGAIAVDGNPAPATRVSLFEDKNADGNGYVLVRGQDLEDVYPPTSNITTWTRDVVFFRPSIFVVYDRTVVANTSGDEHMNWHFPPAPTRVTPPSTGAIRYDVTDAPGGFKGALTTLLPANANVTAAGIFTTVKYPDNTTIAPPKYFRIEVRPQTAQTDSRWLTVLDAAANAASVAVGSVPASSTNVKLALLTASAGNRVAVFGAGAVGQTISGAVTFTEPAAVTKVVVTDLTPSTGYSAVAIVNGTSHNVTIQPGTGFTSSPNGTLYLNIAASGATTAGS